MEPERVGAEWGLEPEGLIRMVWAGWVASGISLGLGLGVVIPNRMV